MAVTLRSISEAEKALEQFIGTTSTGRRYSLDRMRSLMKALDNPQNKLKIIHVAGTSGKTSTAYYCAALLHAAGHTVGLTVSPHIDKVSERAQINLAPLEDVVYCRELSEFLALVKKTGLTPTYFEVLVAFAFWQFHKQNVEYAVVEVGLGGLLDSTNVITRPDKVCVITDIGLDHVEILGNTLGEIAAQKAGIIHSGNTVFMYKQAPEILHAVEATCSAVGAKPIFLSTIKPASQHVARLPLFQQRNLSLALKATQYLLGKPLTIPQINSAADVLIPARAEYIKYLNKTLIIDGSHNPQKLSALIETLGTITQPPILLVSFGENKEASLEENLKILHKISDAIIVTRFSLGEATPRKAVDPAILQRIAQKVGFTDITVEPDPVKALSFLMKRRELLGVVTGSFYLLNHIRPIIKK